MFGWLSNSKSSKSGTKKKTRRGTGSGSKAPKKRDEPRFGWSEARPFLIAAGWMAALGGGTVAWALGRPRLVEYVEAHHATPIEVVFVDEAPPVEMLEEQLADRARLAVSTNPFDVESLARVHELMRISNWFDPTTLRVRRDLQAPDREGSEATEPVVDRIIVDGEFRRPFAFVRRNGSDYLVDLEGYRLPLEYKAGEVTQLIALINPEASAPPTGERWRGGDVHDGLKLIGYLIEQDRPWLDQVRAIDIDNADGAVRGRARLEIVTDLDRRVAWGRAIGDEAGIDIPPRQKIMLIDDQYESPGGRIDHPQGIVKVNLQLKSIDRDE